MKKMLSVLSEKGVSLIELTVSLAIMAISFLFISYFFAGFISSAQKTSENIDTEENFHQASYMMQLMSFYALGVRYTTNDLNRTGSQNGEGYVRSFVYDDFSDIAGVGAVTPIMYFSVERAVSASTNNVVANPSIVGIFFREPTVEESGKVIFSFGGNSSGVLSASQPSVVLDGFIGIELINERYSPNRVMESVDVVLISRRFIQTSEQGRTKKWCPDNDMNLCRDTLGYVDIRKRFTLKFVNNRRDTDRGEFGFPYGSYFFFPQGNM